MLLKSIKKNKLIDTNRADQKLTKEDKDDISSIKVKKEHDESETIDILTPPLEPDLSDEIETDTVESCIPLPPAVPSTSVNDPSSRSIFSGTVQSSIPDTPFSSFSPPPPFPIQTKDEYEKKFAQLTALHSQLRSLQIQVQTQIEQHEKIIQWQTRHPCTTCSLTCSASTDKKAECTSFCICKQCIIKRINEIAPYVHPV